MAVANAERGKPGGGVVAAPQNKDERRYYHAIGWLDRLIAFYGWLNDRDMKALLLSERERLERRRAAFEAVRLGTLKRSSIKYLDVIPKQSKNSAYSRSGKTE